MHREKYRRLRNHFGSVEVNEREHVTTAVDQIYEDKIAKIEACKRCYDPTYNELWDMLSDAKVCVTTDIHTPYSDLEITCLLPIVVNKRGVRLSYFVCDGIIGYLQGAIYAVLPVPSPDESFREIEREDILEIIGYLKSLSCELEAAECAKDFSEFFDAVYMLRRNNPFVHLFKLFKKNFHPPLKNLIGLLDYIQANGSFPDGHCLHHYQGGYERCLVH